MLSAYFALEGFFPSVEVFVLCGVCANCESFAANFAFEFRRTFVGSDVHFYAVPLSVSVVVTDVAVILAVFAMFDGMKSEINMIVIGI